MTLPSRITDDELDGLPIDAGLDALLVELRAEVDVAPTRPNRRWPLVVAAAAAVAVALVVVPILVPHEQDDVPPATTPSEPDTAASTTTSAPTQPPAPDDPVTDGWVGRDRWVVLDAPGWEAAYVDSAPPAGVGLTWTSGGAEFSVQWEAERFYRGRYREAGTESGGATIGMLGQDARYVVYESQQQFAFLPVVDGYGFYVNASFTTEAQFADLVASLREVGTREFDAAMPAGTVAPEQAYAVATDLLRDATTPPGWTTRVGGWNSRTGIAAGMVQPMTCAWARAYVDARADRPGEAENILATLVASKDWELLKVADLGNAFGGIVRDARHDEPDFFIVETACSQAGMSQEMRDYYEEKYPDVVLPPE